MTSLTNSQIDFQNILIIGLGVMGGSFLKKLNESNAHLFAIDKDPEVCKQACKDIPKLTCITFADVTILQQIDLVIVTVMPDIVVSIFDRLDTVLQDSALVIEISGIKEKLVEKLKTKTFKFEYMLTHPMAGRAKAGYTYSEGAIFEGANFLIINDSGTASCENMQKVIALINFLGTTKIHQISTQSHDQHITYTSQLSHVLASSLLNSSDYREDTKDTIGDSFRDLTRIADMNIEMWSALFLENSELLSTSIERLITELTTIKDLVENQDSIALKEQLAVAKVRRSGFDK